LFSHRITVFLEICCIHGKRNRVNNLIPIELLYSLVHVVLAGRGIELPILFPLNYSIPRYVHIKNIVTFKKYRDNIVTIDIIEKYRYYRYYRKISQYIVTNDISRYFSIISTVTLYIDSNDNIANNVFSVISDLCNYNNGHNSEWVNCTWI